MPLPWNSRDGRRFATGSGLVYALALAMAAGGPTPAARADLANRRNATTEAVRKAMPSVMSISSEKCCVAEPMAVLARGESQRPRVSGMGTGVIIDERGYVLTNQHVVDQVQGIEVQLDDGSDLHRQGAPAGPPVGRRPGDAQDRGRPAAPAIPIGCSADLMVGEQVITIGNAFGYEGTTSVGIVTALNRNVTLADDQVYRDLIQTDAGINPGTRVAR